MNKPDKSNIPHTDQNEPVRLNKFLSDAGYCSRRQADELIRDGKVKIDGETAPLGAKVFPGQVVEACGQRLERKKELILLAFHKPAGIECTTASNVKENIVDYVRYPERVYPIGRLDKNSTGLILLTNAGDLVNAISKSVNGHEKEYEVTVDHPVTTDFISKMASGVYLDELNVTTKKCKVWKTGKSSFRIVLTQGLNRQIRRMCRQLGFQVVRLHRIRIMNIYLGDLKEGKYRHVSSQELKALLNELA